MMEKNSAVDQYIEGLTTWQSEYRALRACFEATELHESIKWKHPCYDLDGKNVALIHAFKDYIAILFMKGALLEDTGHHLIQQTENVQACLLYTSDAADDSTNV